MPKNKKSGKHPTYQPLQSRSPPVICDSVEVSVPRRRGSINASGGYAGGLPSSVPTNFNRSDSPSVNSVDMERRTSSIPNTTPRSHRSWIDHDGTSFFSSRQTPIHNRTQSTLDEKEQQRRAGQVYVKPTKIRPPIDVQDTPSFVQAVRAQNRGRGKQHQTFSAHITDWSRSDSEQQLGSKDRSARVSRSSAQNNKESDSGNNAETTSDSETETTTSSESSEDDSQSKHSSQTPRMSKKSNVIALQQAKMGRELIEEIQRKERERTEAATKEAITRLHRNQSQLSPTDQAHLHALKNLIPQRVLAAAQLKLDSEIQPRKKRKRNSTTTGNIPLPPSSPSPSDPHSSATPPNLTQTLTAAKSLILQLASHRLSTTTTTTTTDNPPPFLHVTKTHQPRYVEESTLHRELARIANERDTQIRDLTRENAWLKSEVARLTRRPRPRSRSRQQHFLLDWMAENDNHDSTDSNGDGDGDEEEQEEEDGVKLVVPGTKARLKQKRKHVRREK